MKKQFVKKMHKKLKDQLSEIISLLPKNDADTSVDCHGDETDQIQANLIVSVGEQLSIRQKNKIREINEALDKIKKEIYGICEDCEEDIPEKRLEFNPCFAVCVKCAEIREKELKQSR